MICDCGASTEYEHKVVRNKTLVGKYQKCPACGRILWTFQTDGLNQELEQSRTKNE